MYNELTNPVMKIIFEGKSFVNELEKEYSWNHGEQVEKIIAINSGSGNYNILSLINTIDNIEQLLIYSDNIFVINMTTATNSLNIETKLYLLQPTANFISSLTDSYINTAVTTDINIYLRIYGSI